MMSNKNIIRGGLISLFVVVVFGGLFFVLRYVWQSKNALAHTSHSQGSAVFQSESAWKYAELVQANVLYPIVHVDDGDTFVVHIPDTADADGHDVTVRLIGMDTPETVDPRKSVQCFGPEASAKAKELLESTSLYIEKDKMKGDYEKYGRLLAYARLADGSLYNEYMIKNGFAREYTFSKEPYKYQADFKAAQAAAKKAKLGLWGKCNSK